MIDWLIENNTVFVCWLKFYLIRFLETDKLKNFVYYFKWERPTFHSQIYYFDCCILNKYFLYICTYYSCKKLVFKNILLQKKKLKLNN